MRLRPSTPIRLQDTLEDSYDATGRWQHEHRSAPNPDEPDDKEPADGAGEAPGEEAEPAAATKPPVRRWRPRVRHVAGLIALLLCALYTAALVQQARTTPQQPPPHPATLTPAAPPAVAAPPSRPAVEIRQPRKRKRHRPAARPRPRPRRRTPAPARNSGRPLTARPTPARSGSPSPIRPAADPPGGEFILGAR